MTLQEQYNSIKNGKGHKGVFLTEAKKQFPNMLTNPMGFEEASKILKTRGVISENYVDLKPINTIEASPKAAWENKFAQFLAEEAKAVEKKPDAEVEEIQSHNYDYKDKSNLDNQIGQEVLNGIYFEAKENPDKSLDEIRKMVAKNLAKDGQYYMKNAAFGIKGLGYKETEVEEVAGKYASSGYSDKLKKLVKESSEPDQLNVVFNEQKIDMDELEYTLKRVKKQNPGKKVGYIFVKDAPKGYKISINGKYTNESVNESSEPDQLNVVFNDPEDYIRAKQWFSEESDFYASSEHDEFLTLSFEVADQADADATERAIDQELSGTGIQSWRFEIMTDLMQESKHIKEVVDPELLDVAQTAMRISKEEGVVQHVNQLPGGRGYTISDFYDSDNTIISFENGRKLNESQEQPLKKKVKKESLDADLAEIDTQANIVAMEAKLDKISEIISTKIERLSMIEEDSNLAELVDKGKMKAMQKEIKILEKRKAKMEKIYEKATGKSYTKEIVDESTIDNE